MAKSDKPNDAVKSEEYTPATKLNLPSRIVYLGPSFHEDGVSFKHGEIFNNGLPAEWSAKALLEPAFMRLLVPVEKAASAIAQLRNPESIFAVSHAKVAANVAQRRKERK